MRKFIGLILGIFISIQGFSQAGYSLVEINPADEHLLVQLLSEGLDADHFIKNQYGQIETVISLSDLPLLDQKEIRYDVMSYDLEACLSRNLERDLANIAHRSDCGLQNFSLGSMGGYHTFDETVIYLDSMRQLYPNIISPKRQIGTSIEGRPIWAVKISDNPEVDESSTEPAVYADALTHAREPLSLEVTLYFMWWLLENYGIDPEATYLINEREIFLVPVVNPDGYVFNEVNQPGGGGLWRKNRRIDTVSNICYGIDLNRNYSFGWGDNTGSSSDPCSNTFRGVNPFSEPETHAVQSFLSTINPVIAFSIHSYGNKFLNPLGFKDSVVNYEIYSELAGEYIPDSYFGYGTVKQMLNYISSGTTRDYFHGQGIYGWTPEVGSSFWDAPSTICRQAHSFLKPLKTISWASGAYMKFQNAEAGIAIANQNFDITLRLKNIGLTQDAQNVVAFLKPLTNNVIVLNQTAMINPVAPQQEIVKTFQVNVAPTAGFLDSIVFAVEIQQEGVVSDLDTITFFTGNQQGLLVESFEQGTLLWESGGTGVGWDTTFIAKGSGNVSMADSRYGNHLANSSSTLTLKVPINLQNAHFPKLEFWAKWSLEPDKDFVYVEGKKADENVWIPLSGSYTNSTSGYNGHQSWVREQIDLTPFKDQTINLRFRLESDFLVQGDGFYLDDFRIIDYTEWSTGFSEELLGIKITLYPNPNQGVFSLQVDAPNQGLMTLTLLDLTGRQVAPELKKTFRDGSQEIEILFENQIPGVYMLAIEVDGKRQITKMVIE